MTPFSLTDARLGQHLFHALCAQDRVELPGWGVFGVTPYGADIQLVSGLFLPPARRVAFYPDAAVRGNAFVQQVAHVEQVSLADAGRVVLDVVRSWRVRLDRGDRIVVEAIGAFSMRSGFQWVFQPALEANFLPESYGLPIYRLPVVAAEGESRSLRLPVASRSTVEVPAQRAKRVAAEAMARRESRPSEQEPSASAKPTATQHRIRSNREKWLAPIRSAAVFTGIVGLLVVGGTKPGFQNDLQHVLHEASWMRAPKITWPSMDLFSQPPYEESTEPKPAQGNSPKNELDPAMAPAGTEKPVAGNDAAVSDSKSAPVEVSPTKTPEKENPTPVSAKVDAAWAKPSGASGSSERASDSQGSSQAPVAKEKTAVASRSERFYLVVGAFGDEANAKRMVESLRASGHAAQLVPTSVGTTKVAAAVANSQEEANAKRAALKASFPAVWVFQGNQ